uniref:DUF5723 domain-containing protein n=1 Tax=candidate division WOR-3 bacterium TaxID=2052148 RepID=A0A7C4U6Q7_UNCW3
MRKLFIFLFLFLSIFSQEKHYVTPSRALTTPVYDVLKSLDFFLSGGGTVGIEGEAYALGNVNMDFGDLFELEVSVSSIVNAVENKSSLLPTSTFKMKLLSSNELKAGLTFLMKKTMWNIEYDIDTKFSYYTRFSELMIIGGFKNNYINLNFGGKITDLRAQIKMIDSIVEGEKMKKSYGGFFNILIQVNPKTYGIFEISDKIRINYIGKTHLDLDRNVSQVISVSLGGRYFFNEFISIDAGTLWRSDYKGIGDAVINAGVNIGIPFEGLGKEIFKE